MLHIKQYVTKNPLIFAYKTINKISYLPA